jgi:hypothetical protein
VQMRDRKRDLWGVFNIPAPAPLIRGLYGAQTRDLVAYGTEHKAVKHTCSMKSIQKGLIGR